MYQTLLTNFEDGIFIITINRPEKLNALNKTVIEELSVAIDEVYTTKRDQINNNNRSRRNHLLPAQTSLNSYNSMKNPARHGLWQGRDKQKYSIKLKNRRNQLSQP